MHSFRMPLLIWLSCIDGADEQLDPVFQIKVLMVMPGITITLPDVGMFNSLTENC